MTGTNQTEDGQPIDIIFGYQSVSDRIVLSAELNGTTATLLRVIGSQAADLYFSKE